MEYLKPVDLDVLVATGITVLAGWSCLVAYGLVVVHYRQRTREKAARLATTIARNKKHAKEAPKREKKMEHNVMTAIARSISHNEIVTITPREYRDTIRELEQLCDDGTILYQYGKADYWGTYKGEDWRVHVAIDVEAVVEDWLTDSATSIAHGLASYCASWHDWDVRTLAYDLAQSIVQDLDDMPLNLEMLKPECLRLVTKYQEKTREIVSGQ